MSNHLNPITDLDNVGDTPAKSSHLGTKTHPDIDPTDQLIQKIMEEDRRATAAEAEAAAWDALKETSATLQESAVDLIKRLCAVKAA